MSRVVVVGAGIAGLSAAHAVAKSGVQVTLLEAADAVGGKLRTDAIEGLPVEAGADSFLATTDEVLGLCTELGLAGDLVTPALFGAHLLIEGSLRRLAPGSLFGLPSAPLHARRAGLLTTRGALRAGFERAWPRPLRGPDVSIGAFVRRRFGHEVLERMVDPLIAGTRSGRPDELSLAAATPEIDKLARSHRSVGASLRTRRDGGAPAFCSLAGGLGRLASALAGGLADVRLACPVAAVHAGSVELASGEVIGADGVIVAVPAPDAARLLARACPRASACLATIVFTPVAVVTLVYAPGALTPPPGASGVLVPAIEGKALAACTWYSRKWPEAFPAGAGQVVRCFVGRAGSESLIDLTDERMIECCHREIADMVPAREPPRSASVVRWRHGLPQYTLGHRERVAHIEQALSAFPAIRLAGASYRGAGIPDCVRSGLAAARYFTAEMASACRG